MGTVKIKGMSCGHCVNSTKNALEAIDGLSDVNVDLDKGEATYTGDIDREVIKKAIADIGFEVI